MGCLPGSVPQKWQRRGRFGEKSEATPFVTSHQYDSITGDLEQALKIYQLWKQTYPRDVVPLTNLGYEYGRLGQLENAEREIREALRLDPDNGVDTSNLAYVEVAQNRFEEAKADFERALVRYPDNMVAH